MSDPSSTPMSDEQEDELRLTRDLDTIQAFIWARIKDEADARELKLSTGDCYSLGSVIKEELHPRVRQLLVHHTKEAVAKARKHGYNQGWTVRDRTAPSRNVCPICRTLSEEAAPQQSTSPDGSAE